jgi:hypothetical protein
MRGVDSFLPLVKLDRGSVKLESLQLVNAHVFDKLYHDPAAMRAYTAAGVKDLGLSFLHTSHGLPQAAARKVAEMIMMLITPSKVRQYDITSDVMTLCGTARANEVLILLHCPTVCVDRLAFSTLASKTTMTPLRTARSSLMIALMLLAQVAAGVIWRASCLSASQCLDLH